MILSRDELLVLLGLVQVRGMPWRIVRRAIPLQPMHSQKLREGLEANGCVRKIPGFIHDKLGHRRRVEFFEPNPDIPQVRELRAWVDSGQATPLPLLAFGEVTKPVLRAPPGQHATDIERVLDAILRNPGVTWRNVRRVSGIDSQRADQARSELYRGSHLTADLVARVDKRGRTRKVPIDVPNEGSALVRELRKRYGIKPVGANVIPVTQPDDVFRDPLRPLTVAQDGMPIRPNPDGDGYVIDIARCTPEQLRAIGNDDEE